VSASGLLVDFTGSSPQIVGFKNSSIANTYSSVYLAVLSFLGGNLPKNDGTFRPITVVAPEGTIVNARPPAPMTMNTVFPATNIVHACWKALAGSDSARACAGWGKSLHCVTSGPAPNGSTYVMYHWHGLPAAGAVQGRDGFPTIGTVPTLCGLRLANVEAYEQLYPVRIHKYEMRRDAAGAGEFRGGTGVDYVADVDTAADYSFRGEGAHGLTAFGVNGGQEGRTGSLSLTSATGEPIDAPQFGVRKLPPLRVTIGSPAGGGFGDPLRRDPEAVLRDVLDEVVSLRQAREVYGVALTGDPLRVDADATTALRGALAPREKAGAH
jgi:N-methylhydantoinase B